MAELNLRADRLGYRVHVPRKGKESGWFNIVDLKRDDFDYEKCVVCTCHNLDVVEAFIIEKEKEAQGGS